jgi:hypothetical protein
VSTEIDLFSFNDQNLADNGNQDGSNTSFGISSFVFVQPQFFYNCWVWAGADAYGDEIDTGFSFSSVGLSANVSSLVFDSF